MTDKKTNDLILAYLTPDLFGLTRESLIFEIIWLRYCLDFYDAESPRVAWRPVGLS